MAKSSNLPIFKYHPDPLSTGAVRADADAPCLNCDRARGYIYVSPVYTEQDVELDDHLCPWCIADGAAAQKLGATFNNTGVTGGIPGEIRAEVEARTSGFNAWQEVTRLACCGSAAAFPGAAGAEELKRDFPKAAPVVKRYLRQEFELSGEEAQEFLEDLSKDDSPAAYVFRCLRSNQYLTFVDEE